MAGLNFPDALPMKKVLYYKSHVACLLLVLLHFTTNAQTQLLVYADRDTLTQNDVLPSTTERIKGKAEKQRLLAFLKQIDLPEAIINETSDNQWNQLAGTFTRLRLYPLAMKCFLKTLDADSLAGDIPITINDEQHIQDQLKLIGHSAKAEKCDIIQVSRILQTFNDGKTPMAYAMILHVKQPVRGTPKVHKLAYTGHTFITLIKFNTDSSYAAITFGFGPHKNSLLAATPLMPSSPSKFTNDGGHEWDEVVGKFISRRRFQKILKLTSQYDGLAYNLSTNNCTDFGLAAARLAGLEIRDTKGSWPLGAGNNPGNAGESILLGKFSNMDTGSFDRLYIDTASNTAKK